MLGHMESRPKTISNPAMVLHLLKKSCQVRSLSVFRNSKKKTALKSYFFLSQEGPWDARSSLEAPGSSGRRRGRAQTVQHPKLHGVWYKFGQDPTKETQLTKTDVI